MGDGTVVTLCLINAVSSATAKVEERVDTETANDLLAGGVVARYSAVFEGFYMHEQLPTTSNYTIC